MARQRNNIYAVAADAVDLALDTAGTIVGGVANIIGIGIGSSGQTTSEKEEQKDVDDAADRVATRLRQKAKDAASRPHKAKTAIKRVAKTHRAKSVKSVKKASGRRTAKRVSA